jgi:hypothetical protein
MDDPAYLMAWTLGGKRRVLGLNMSTGRSVPTSTMPSPAYRSMSCRVTTRVLFLEKPNATVEATAAILPWSAALMVDTADVDTPSLAAAAAARVLPAALVQWPWAMMVMPWQ